MPDTESKGDILMFRETLAELERLVDVRVKGSLFYGSAGKAMDDGMIYMLKLLTELDVNTSELNAIDDLERLVDLRSKRIESNNHYFIRDSCSRSILDKMIDSKINFINKGSFSRVDSKDDVDPMVALKRLAAVQRKIESRYLDGVLGAKIRETRSVQPDTASYNKVAAVSQQVSETQENSKRDLSNQCKDSKAATRFISSPFSWHQNQDSIRADDDDDGSTLDGSELTPTSTIVSEFPDPNGG